MQEPIAVPSTPVQTPQQDITFTFHNDFNQELKGYWCEAIQGDVKASLAVLPSKNGDGYVITQRDFGKVNPIGKLGRNQKRRALKLLDDLVTKVQEEMVKSGWVEVGISSDVSKSTLYRRNE
jgi:hypothetical protein